MLKEGSCITMASKGYSLVYNAIEDDNSIIASITEGLSPYVEKQAAMENAITNMNNHTAYLAHQVTTQQSQLQAFMQNTIPLPWHQLNYEYQQPTVDYDAALFSPAQLTFRPNFHPMDISNRPNKRQESSPVFQMQQPPRPPPQAGYSTFNSFQQTGQATTKHFRNNNTLTYGNTQQ